MSRKFYITTPIYYPNDIPHIGNAYTSFIADLIARFQRLRGYEVKFSTGTDENSQKIVQKADEKGVSVKDFLEDLAQQHRNIRDTLQISYTDFIRTTQSDHATFVQKTMQVSYEKGDIYKGLYEGLYCVGCEEFKKESDLIEKDGVLVCPDHLKKPDIIKEENRFFRLSAYTEKLKAYFAENPNLIKPAYRGNEVKQYLESGLEDFSISRANAQVGIPLPFDPESKTYVRYDALLNYLTVCQAPDQQEFATHMTHVIGKNIAKFHLLYRPAMLMSAGLSLPRWEVINGFLTIDGLKISKSLGNAISPVDVVAKTDRDALVLYYFYDLKIGSDGDFSLTRFQDMYQSMLGGGRGNLVNRVITMCAKNGIQTAQFSQKQRDILSQHNQENANPLLEMIHKGWDDNLFETVLQEGDFQPYVRNRYELVQMGNKTMDTLTPWIKLKNETTQEEGKADLAFLLRYIIKIGILSSPFLINGRSKLQNMLGNKELMSIQTQSSTENIKALFDLSTYEVDLDPSLMYILPEK